jgi:elongation factor G
MKVYDAASIRNVALVGHTGSGKTQLASAILADTGMVNRFGKVDDGTTVTDFDEEEIARKHTLSASLAYAEWNKHKINLIDTPGIGNFLSDARAALHVADGALVVVDAVAGVMVQTEKVWAAAADLSLPRLIVVNRIDRERASLERTLQGLQETCSRTAVPIQLPIGEERSFKGVVDLVTRKAFVYQLNESGSFEEAAVPADMAAAVEHAR